MQKEKFSKQFGGTAACTFRLVDATAHAGSKWETRVGAKANTKRELFAGDSWLSSVPVAEGLMDRGHEYVGALETNHALYPKDEIEKLMTGYPSGAVLVFECTTPKKGHKLLAIGYKYNARKVLCFIATKNAGSTMPGEPYIARFNDVNSNVAERPVSRPPVLSRYFSKCNGIDAHNQGQQGILALEKQWLTKDPWFRLATTLFGMVVTNCWKAYRHALPNQHPKKHVKLVEFTDQMACNLVNNNASTEVGGGSLLPLTVDFTVNPGGGQPKAVSPLSATSTATSLEYGMTNHLFVENSDEEATKTGSRGKRRACMYTGCKKPTSKMCDNYRCRLRSYQVNEPTKYGYFYCCDHFAHHWMDVIGGQVEA